MTRKTIYCKSLDKFIYFFQRYIDAEIGDDLERSVEVSIFSYNKMVAIDGCKRKHAGLV